MQPRVMLGTVEVFDEIAGLGSVRGADGAVYPLHCTQLADGTRTIPVGTKVAFEVMAGHQGRWEAASVQRC